MFCLCVSVVQPQIICVNNNNFSMAGSSRDHERGAHLPDELSDILRSLSERQTNILYYALTNQHVRGYFLDLLQNRVTEIAENHTRAAAGHSPGTPTVLSKPMPKQRPALLKTTTAVAPYRPPGSCVTWRPNVVNYIVPPPPLPPPSTPAPEVNSEPSSSSSTVKAFCAKASATATIPDVLPSSNPPRRDRSRSRSRSSSAETLS